MAIEGSIDVTKDLANVAEDSVGTTRGSVDVVVATIVANVVKDAL